MTAPSGPPSGSLAALIDRMERLLDAMVDSEDELRHFHGVYLRMTRAIADQVGRGAFHDPAWVAAWDVRFAELYLRALDLHTAEEPPPRPWAIAFTAVDEGGLPPPRQVLLCMNAHLNYDLPQALLGVIGAEEFDQPDALARRAADHERLDALQDLRLTTDERWGSGASLGRSLHPLDRLAVRRFVREARRKAWSNARQLAAARRSGEENLAAALGELERRSAARVALLAAPGPVTLRLAVHGFGVSLPASVAPAVPPLAPPATQ